MESFPREDTDEDQLIATANKQWFKTIEGPAVSAFQKLGDDWGHLVCVLAPAPPNMEGKVLLVAVMPIAGIEPDFLSQVNLSSSTATLVDETGLVLATDDKRLVNTHLSRGLDHDRYRQLIQQYVSSGTAHTEVFGEDLPTSDGRAIPSQIVCIEPIKVGGAKLVAADYVAAGRS